MVHGRRADRRCGYTPTVITTDGAHGHPGGDLSNLILTAPDGSQAHVAPDGALTQSGPCRLWDDVESTHQAWRSLGAPARERFGLTVTPQHQTIWLDTPDSDHRWPVG